MTRFAHFKSLTVAAIAALGVVVACRAAAPGEAPPLAPRPTPVEPAIARPNRVPKPPGRNPLAPAPNPQPVVINEIPVPDYQGAAYPAATDAGVGDIADAVALEPPGDAVPTDARKTATESLQP